MLKIIISKADKITMGIRFKPKRMVRREISKLSGNINGNI
jgi:hypothetical protein